MSFFMLNTFCAHTFETNIFHMWTTKIIHQKENYKAYVSLSIRIQTLFSNSTSLFRELTFYNVVLPCY